uniref:Telomere length regulation protein TEL2 homolog n=1 Tax=Electrophorus electricus TaxID=8005 RepID=A0A4W4EI03_ELEEL
MRSSSPEAEVRVAVGSCLRCVATSRRNEETDRALRALARYLEDGDASASRRAEFNRAQYTRVLQVLVRTLSSDWFHSLCAERRKELWDTFFLKGPPDQALMMLLDSVNSISSGLEQCVRVLENFLSSGRVRVLLWSKCEGGSEHTDSARLRETVLGRLAALPTLAANRLHTHTPVLFLPQQYYQQLACDILATLEKTCQTLRVGQDCSLGFVAQLLGKVCMQGHGGLVCGMLAPHLSSLTRSDVLWQRVSCKLLENVPERWVESVITALIHNLTVLGYLALEEGRRLLLRQVLQSVCEVWCNSSAVRHTPVEQQLYVSKALLLCVSLLNHTDIQELREGNATCRLDSNIECVRRIGMVVGECLSQKLDPPTSQLKFQVTFDLSVSNREFLIILCCNVSYSLPSFSTSFFFVFLHSSFCLSCLSFLSDDDLTPYDMSHDQVKQKVTSPHYIRDCLEALMSSNDPERLELSLQVAEELLRKNISATREVSVKFTKVLLHLEDRYNTTGFYKLRQNAMVALAVMHTQPVVEYLTTEFYSLNYSLRQRLDILEVLALSAQELSEPIPDKRTGPHSVTPATTLELCGEVEHWRQVVEKRIQSKTRRISKGVSQPPKATPNRYAPVAGYFFFPLLRNYDRQQVTFDLLGNDHLVLGRLMHTLGLLMHLAINAPVATQMGKALLDFVWAVRFHADQMVRRGVLFAVCAVFLSMPSENLLMEISDDLLENRAWLADIAENDPDADCRSLAMQSLVLLERNVKSHLKNPPLEA